MHEPESSGLVQTHKSHSQRRAWRPDLCLVDLKVKVQIFVFGLFSHQREKIQIPTALELWIFPKLPKLLTVEPRNSGALSFRHRLGSWLLSGQRNIRAFGCRLPEPNRECITFLGLLPSASLQFCGHGTHGPGGTNSPGI